MTHSGLSRILVPPAEAALSVAPPRSDRRLNLNPQQAEKGLSKLVLTLVDLLRQLLEREAMRRMERSTLTDEEIERLGTAFLLLQDKIAEMRDIFGLTEEDLNIDLGPLGRVL